MGPYEITKQVSERDVATNSWEVPLGQIGAKPFKVLTGQWLHCMVMVTSEDSSRNHHYGYCRNRADFESNPEQEYDMEPKDSMFNCMSDAISWDYGQFPYILYCK